MSIVICPECGKELSVSDPGRKFMFCRHCGTKIEIASFTKKTQGPIITPPPPKDQLSEVPSQGASVEQLRHQHKLEMEQLRYEHELELERLRYENELKQERIKSEYARAAEKVDSAEFAEPAEEAEYVSPAPKVRKHSAKKKSLSWKAGHFCKKHPIWAFIIVIAFFQLLFGGTSDSANSPASSSSSGSSLSNASHYKYAYCHIESEAPTSYYLFNFDDKKVCFTKTGTNKAWIADLQAVESENDFEAVFYFMDGTITRKFKFSDTHILDVTEIVSGDSPSEDSYQYEEVGPNGSMDILSTVTRFVDCSSPA